ncbi:Ferrichrome-iron receptor [Escherichia coli ISC41]|nr:Ferrichrome-iron receptor [Escherichia coli ISC41]
MIVTGNTAADTTDSAAGAGFKTNDIDVGPLGTKSWIETPYSSTTVTKEMIENQQAQSVSEMLKYSPSTQMQARGGMDVGRPQSRGDAGQRGGQQPSGRAEYRFNNRVSGGNA